MRFLGRSLAVACTAACAFAIATSAAVAATEPVPSPSPSASAAPTGSPLREIGRVRAVTPFCRLIFDDAAALADDQLADIRTTTEVLRILAYAPLDRDVFTERRAVKALQTLSDRLMASRRGTAQVHVAGLRTAARGADGQAPRPDLARFAGALDGAHSESSRVAHEIAGVVSVLDVPELAVGGLYLPDYRFAHDPRFARAEAPVPFPVDAELERFPAGYTVENGPLHVYARFFALQVASSLEQMLASIDEAKRFFPTAFVGCVDVDVSPSPSASRAPKQ